MDKRDQYLWLRNIMITKAKQAQVTTTIAGNTPLNEFNFELWVKQVKPQLLASLQKRGMR